MLKAKFNPVTRSKRSGDPKRPAKDAASAPSSAARNLALAHYLERMIERGIIVDYTQAARMLGVTQARMSHLMGLLLLAPTVQEAILWDEIRPRDKELRGMARVAEWQQQEAKS